MTQNKILKRIWEILYPMVLYFGIQMITVYVGFIITVSFYLVRGFARKDAVDLAEGQLLLLNLIAALIAAPVFTKMYHKVLKKQQKYRTEYETSLILKFFWIIPFGVVGMFWSNYVVSFLTLFMPEFMIDSYDETKEIVFNSPFLLQVFASALMAPVVEELIFRGVIHNRLKEYMTVKNAAILSSLLFGLYHMNWIQIPYAFLIGMLSVFLFEKYKTIYASIIFHGIANLTSVLISMAVSGQETGTEEKMSMVEQCAGLLILIGFSGILLCGIGTIINKRVNEKEKFENEVINDYDSML